MRRPLLFAGFETLLTGACLLVWYALAGLVRLASEPSVAGRILVLVYAIGLSLPLTWALRALPLPALRRAVDRAVLARAGASVVVTAGLAIVLLTL
ncbi:hypothetical protein OG562_26840 [Streptomyces sp. NBC_01275]|nr:hypothetical protein [Streptomyces sp. NBC_01275]